MSNVKEDKKYKIGEVAKNIGISVETIRMYERSGILLTQKSQSGQRYFNENDLHWINCIRRLIKEQGLNLEGIRRMLALLPCLELRPCSEEEKKNCPAFNGAIVPCWTMKSKVPISCQDEDCCLCSVYQSAIACENLKKVLYQSNQEKRPLTKLEV